MKRIAIVDEAAEAARTTARAHPFAFVFEALLFLAFFGGFLVMATLRSSTSTWAMIPHVAINLGVIALIARHYLQRRPRMYWSRFDFGVALLFLAIVVNVYYSEIRAVSWRSAALYVDALGAFLFGRFLFFQRLRWFAAASVITLVIGWIGAESVIRSAVNEAAANGTQVSVLLVDRLEGVKRIILLAGAFFVISFPFLNSRRPSNPLFLLYGCVILGGYLLIAFNRVYGLVANPVTSRDVVVRHLQYENFETAWRIVLSYPLTGCGLGTLSWLFDAFRETPAVPRLTSLNAYVYALVELGPIATLLIVWLLFRLPWHTLRHWDLFPNRRLRMGVTVWLAFAIIAALHGLLDAAAFTPAAWYLLWANFGVLTSLVFVRDPVRIFETTFAVARAEASGEVDDVVVPDREFRPMKGSVFARTAIGTVRRRLLPVQAARAAAAARRRRLRLKYFTAPIAETVPLALSLACGILLLTAESLPYAAARMAEPRNEQREPSSEYLTRLERSAKLFPLASETWARIAENLQGVASGPLALYGYSERIEEAFRRAIRANPYRPAYYEQLYQVFRQTNNTQKAVEIVKQGVQNNPNDLALRMLLVRELEHGGSLAFAKWHVRQAVNRIAPDRVDLFLRLAEIYEASGQKSLAARWIQYARQVTPNLPETVRKTPAASEAGS